jgi:HPt (histidine-containing phosphotransfer) domain-containing protein
MVTAHELAFGMQRCAWLARERRGILSMDDLLAERLAAIRQRFVTRLDARIGEIERAMSQTGRLHGPDVIALAHREAHSLCGIGPTLGFVETGKVARSIEQLLLVAVKAERVLTDEEIPRLGEGIAMLRAVAIAESPAAGAHCS